jgi:hypothetical protein
MSGTRVCVLGVPVKPVVAAVAKHTRARPVQALCIEHRHALQRGGLVAAQLLEVPFARGPDWVAVHGRRRALEDGGETRTHAGIFLRHTKPPLNGR